MSLVTNTSINKQQYAEGFNQGMQQSAETFSLMIQFLVLSFGIKVLLHFPPVNQRINSWTDYDIVDVMTYSADVLAFFLTVMIYWTLIGNNLIA